MKSAASAAWKDERQNVQSFMLGFSLETTPRSAAKIPDFREHVRPGTSIYITFLPGSDVNDTIALAKRLRSEGFNPVPHLAARSLRSKNVLEDSLKSLTGEADVTQVLLIAGSVPSPLGEFSDTMQVLATGLLDKHGIKKIGVAGHPEGSPDIAEDAMKHALSWKNEFAKRTGAQMYLLTQFCFEAAPILAWDRHIQAEGNRLPIHIGIPGLATVKTLMAHAKACGIGPSMRFITRQAMSVAKLLTASAPDKLVADLASYQAENPSCGITGVHIYPLGGLEKSAQWSYAVADGRFTFKPDRRGFAVDMLTPA